MSGVRAGEGFVTRRVRPRRWWAWLMIGAMLLGTLAWAGQPRVHEFRFASGEGGLWRVWLRGSIHGVSVSGAYQAKVPILDSWHRIRPVQWTDPKGLGRSGDREDPDSRPRLEFKADEFKVNVPTWGIAPLVMAGGFFAWRKSTESGSRVRRRVGRSLGQGSIVAAIALGISLSPLGWNAAASRISGENRSLSLLSDSQSVAFVSAHGNLGEWHPVHIHVIADVTRQHDGTRFEPPAFKVVRVPSRASWICAARLQLSDVIVRTAVVDWWVLLLALGLPTAWVAWRTRRLPPAGCSGCGYDLAGQAAPGCPECGQGRKPFGNEKGPHQAGL